MQSNVLMMLLFSLCGAAIVALLPEGKKKFGILILNIAFYALCDLRFLGVMVGSVVFSFLLGRGIQKKTREKACNVESKRLLAFGVVAMTGLLFLFKYWNFFLPEGLEALSLAMPLGISYYVFKTISFLVDSYRGEMEEATDLVDYAVCISFFPQIVCGPIARPKQMLHQIRALHRPTGAQVADAYFLILSGLFKKLVIADRLSGYVNTIFGAPASYPGLALVMAAFFYTVQLYCDFAGYSEIAIGVGKLLGIETDENFHLPYFSYSIKDFWTRWHISLSSWLKDYVYIPLGGNRKGRLRKGGNIMATFLVSGLWHGNGLQFLLWGAWHGAWNLISKEKAKSKIGYALQILGTFLVVMFGWILFRAQSVQAAGAYIGRMVLSFRISYNDIVSAVLPFTMDNSSLAYFLTVIILIAFLFFVELKGFLEEERRRSGVFQERESGQALLRSGAADKKKEDDTGKADGNLASSKTILCGVYLVLILVFGVVGQNSFLYANF